MTIKTHKRFAKTTMSYFRSKPLRVVFAILWVLFVGIIIALGFEPNPYALHVLDVPEPYSYPIELVVILVMAMLFHLSLLVTMDVYMDRRWKLFAMLITSVLFLLYFGMMAMHAPPSLGGMIFWTFLSSLLFLLLCFWQACLFVLRRFFSRA
ncbi:hypothetical protein [Psychrobacter sp. P2G3]|uniref:hypothetical protein n=1 Tax=Psychrobacter sp. P2G3 TaxID=1699622 RepID=UPI00078B69FA|nr:hypothetical protein [Psychrobacter sp. P2G3]AMN50138.1 hypothetical protein AK823_09865 [Psychrobacter sp. P2G3]